MALAGDTTGDHAAATLSNEALYQNVWSTFVDGVIARHRQESPGAGTGRIELRDVMRLEQVLAKIENAEAGGWIDYEGRQAVGASGLLGGMETELSSIGPDTDSLLPKNERQSPETTSGLPPMFQNPGASFLVSMYNPVSARRKTEDRPPPPPLSVQASRSSSSSSSGSRGSTPTAAACGGQQLAVPHAQEQAPTTPPRDGTEDTRGRNTGGEEQAKQHASCADSICSSPEIDAFPEDDPLTQLSVRLDATHIEDTETGADASVEGGEKSEGGRDPEPALLMLSSLASPEQESSASDDVSALEASRHSSVLGGEEERLPLGGQPDGIVTGVTVPSTSRCTDHDDIESHSNGAFSEAIFAASAVDSDEANDDSSRRPTLPAATTSTRNTTGRDTATEQLTEPGSNHNRRSPLESELERKAPAGGEDGGGQESLLSGEIDPVGSQNAPGESSDRSVQSGERSACLALSLDGPAVTKSSKEADISSHSSTSDRISSRASSLRHAAMSQEGRRRQLRGQPGGRRSRSHGSGSSESPELVLAGSASSQDSGRVRDEERSSTRGAWGEGATASSRRCRSDALFDSSNVELANLSLARSPDGAATPKRRQQRGDGPAGSVDIGGFGGCGGVDALSLSPLNLAGPLDTSEADGDIIDEERGRGGDSNCWDVSAAGGVEECGLSPVRSARSESTFEFDDGASSPQRSREAPFLLEGEEEDDGDSGDVTLTPEVSRTSPFAHAGAHEQGGGDCGWGDFDVAAEVDDDVESGSLMPPPPSRQHALGKQAKDRRHQEALTPEASTHTRETLAPEQGGRGSSVRNPGPARAAFTDRTNGGWYNDGDGSRHEKSTSEATVRSAYRGREGGGVVFNEQASICSFTDSEAGRSRVEDSFRDGCEGGGGGGGDGSSLVEGTPRRRGVGSGKEDLGGYYPPLQVANTATAKAQEGLNLSTLQRSTLQWMAWRERGEQGAGGGGEEATLAAAMASSSSDNSSNDGADNDIKGGTLGHLSSEEASTCLHALLKGGVASEDTTAGRGVQRRTHPGTGLPCGKTLILAPTKEAVWRWSDRLESGAGGMSVLSYVMPLRERRRISAKQAAAFDVVVTTYDVLKAKEVPRGVVPSRSKSPRRWALPGSAEWRTRNSKQERQDKPAAAAACKTDHLVSVLHGVWWDRVVADEAQILATQRSARAAAALSLVGAKRWCVVERESMAVVESNSERMRSLAAFLRVPADVPMVQAAESLFYASRPSHIAPLHPPRGGAADNSLSLNDGYESRTSSPGSSQRVRRPRSRKSASGDSSRPGVDGSGTREARSNAGGKGGPSGRKGLGSSAVTRNDDVDVEGRGNMGKESSRTGAVRGKKQDENRRCEAEGGAARGEMLSRGHVTYTATKLRLRRTGGVGGVVQFG